MTDLSRRNLLAGLGATGLGLFANERAAGALIGHTTSVPLASDDKRAPEAETLKTDSRKKAEKRILEYLGSEGPKLLRPPAGILKHSSVSPSLPGAAYSTQLWDWDTLWTSRALFRLSNLQGDRDLHKSVSEHVQGSVLNFVEHQSSDGRIPIMLSVSDPDPFGCLKSIAPNYRNQAKPVMAQIALLASDEIGDVEWLSPVFDRLLLFLDSWKSGNGSSTGLLVWGDDVAIGDDNDPTTFGRPFFSSANLLLNCLYYQDLSATAELARRLKRTSDALRFENLARMQGESIQKYCWDPRDRFYYTVDVQCVDRRSELLPNFKQGMAMSWSCLPLRIQMFTGFLPMWCGLATKEQASDLVNLHYLNRDTFNATFGVRSLSKSETMYSLAFSSDPSNWLGPLWIIVNYLVWKGLVAYGFTKEAEELADKTVRLLAADLETKGSLNEFYDPDTGSPLSHNGFLDWNMLVLEMIAPGKNTSI